MKDKGEGVNGPLSNEIQEALSRIDDALSRIKQSIAQSKKVFNGLKTRVGLGEDEIKRKSDKSKAHMSSEEKELMRGIGENLYSGKTAATGQAAKEKSSTKKKRRPRLGVAKKSFKI